MESISIFSHKIDPEGVLGYLREIVPKLEVTEAPEGSWKRADLKFESDGMTLLASFRHDPNYYSGDEWDRQLAGMQIYCRSFPDSPNKATVIDLIQSFRFALSVLVDPPIGDDDPRAPILFAAGEFLDGVLFTPDSIRDSSGRILLGRSSPSDEDAALPHVPGQVATEPVEPEKEPERRPPSPERVARRLFVLAAVCGRAVLEREDPKQTDVFSIQKRIQKWVEELDLRSEFEAEEWALVLGEHGQLDPQETVNATWRFEGLAVLGWAMKLNKIPEYDQLVEPWDLLREVYFLHKASSSDLLDSPEVRPEAELEGLRDTLHALHWRLKEQWLAPKPVDFEAYLADRPEGSLDAGEFRFIDKDLALREHSISDAPRELFDRCHSAAHERHLAIRWLLGYSPIYSRTDVSS